MQLVHDVFALHDGSTPLWFYLSLSTQMKEVESQVEGYNRLLQIAREQELKLKELATLWNSSENTTRELETQIEEEGSLAEKQA